MFKVFFFSFSLLMGMSLYSAPTKVIESEIQSGSVNFKNRSNRRADISIKRTNILIGKKLAKAASSDQRFGRYKGFSIQRFVSKEKGKFGGDILTIGMTKKYGHIHSLQRILSSYIRSSFRYSSADSKLLSRLILFYNATHRNDKVFFEQRYTSVLTKQLVDGKIGISKSYKNWAGGTQLIIPIEISILNDGRSDIPLDELGDTIEKEVDKNKDAIQNRKDLEDLFRRKLEEERKKISLQKKELGKTKLEIQKKLDDPNTQRDILKELNKAIEDIEDKEKELDKKSEILDKKDSKLNPSKFAEKNKSLADNIQKTKATNAKIRNENLEIKKQTESIKVENKKLETEIQKTKAPLVATKDVINGKVIFLKIKKYIAKGRYNNSIYLLDPEKDDVLTEGKFHNITSKDYKEFKDNIVLIGYQENHINTNRLILLDKSNLEYKTISESNIFWDTPIEIDQESIFAIEDADNKFYLSKFDQDLRKVASSKIEVNPFSTITIFKDKIYLTSNKEFQKVPSIVVLNKKDLQLIKVVDEKKP
jgi:hypothetical protein